MKSQQLYGLFEKRFSAKTPSKWGYFNTTRKHPMTSPIIDRQPPKFKIGDEVHFKNDYGVEFKDKIITGIEYWDGYPTPRYFYTPSGNPAHYSSKECNFTLIARPTREQMQTRLDELNAYFDAHPEYEGVECNAECWREYSGLQAALNKPAQ